MQENRFTKSDWMLFKNKIADWQEAYMDRLNKEYIELLSEDANSDELKETVSDFIEFRVY